MPNPRSQTTTPFDERLTLAKWFALQLGYRSNLEMLEDLRECPDVEDVFHPVTRVIATQGKAKIPEKILVEMNHNIYADLYSINRCSEKHYCLKYFQYLAVLAVEYFLHRLSEGPKTLLKELQDIAQEDPERYPTPATVEGLSRLVLWMASGAGKTLIMHLNYYQILRWWNQIFSIGHRIDCIVLLTPNESESVRHIKEMRDSGIPCFRHEEDRGGAGMYMKKNSVRVLEITKLTDGYGTRDMPSTREFEGSNIILVDEGYATGDKAWQKRRDEMVAGGGYSIYRGFLFEYGATFGQVFGSSGTANGREDEYAQSVILDYSYRHFHKDGYGKDFDVVGFNG